MAFSLDLDKQLDKAYEQLGLTEILDSPVAALAGVSEAAGEKLAALGIKTVRDLGTNKYFAFASALAELERTAK
ncbi:hypothetical protein KCV87_06870 [Actinosynnema pretiosum subsp. pretiosum]|uniref:Uncharacterized protein n=2 Tax=Actinosynnema TaxID=40566 RepID=C6WMP0_ACTMD|nr:hypothetical protein [Actinosynnema mirum]ACU36569.1 conserved hypothetical protein [Actinosynnema mirum DSM 43827]QUF05799.1 hypothetical protein KCV87_06870 [Actinosynnema pretiosum subsp. pretiosum]